MLQEVVYLCSAIFYRYLPVPLCLKFSICDFSNSQYVLSYLIQICSWITRGRVLSGELYAQKNITEPTEWTEIFMITVSIQMQIN